MCICFWYPPNSLFFPSSQKPCSPLFCFLILEKFILLFSSFKFLKSFRSCWGGKKNWL